MNLKEQFLSKETNFHLVRHLAALGVIFNHSYILQTGSKVEQPLRAQLGISFGELSLDFFFFVSGYFIALSMQTRDDFWKFLAVRSARLHPALILSLCLGCFVVAPVFGGLSLWEIVIHPGVALYLIKNVTMFTGMIFNLPGDVFRSNPFPYSVNGAIWTLALEARLILGLGLVWWLLKQKTQRTVIVSWLALIVGISCLGVATWLRVEGEYVHPGWRLHWVFLLGAWIRLTPLSLPQFRPVYLWLLAGGFAGGVAVGPKIFPILWPILSPLAIASLSFMPIGIARRIPRNADYSYGLFVFAFPIQQSLVAVGVTSTPTELFFASLAIAFPVSVACWHFLEKPVSGWVKRQIE